MRTGAHSKNLVLAAMVFAVAIASAACGFTPKGSIAEPWISFFRVLGKTSSQAGEYILWFFVGFVIAAQVGGRILDQRGARPSVLLGGALAAVGFFLLAGKLTDLSLGAQRLDITIAVFYIMAGVLAATFIVAVRWLPRGRVEQVAEEAPPVPEVALR